MNDDDDVATFATKPPVPPAASSSGAGGPVLDYTSGESVVSPAAAEKPIAVGSVNLLDWEDDTPAAKPVAAASAADNRIQLKDFVANFMTPQLFQQKWVSSADFLNTKATLIRNMPTNPAVIEEALRLNKVSDRRWYSS